MYRYLNIRGDSRYGVFLPVERIQRVLADLPELSQSSARKFESVPGKPWFLAWIIGCDLDGNYPAGISQTSQAANLVELICSDRDPTNQAFYERLALGISEALGWEVVDDGTSEPIEKSEPA